MAGLAGGGGRTERCLEVVQIAGLGRSNQLGHFSHVLVGRFLEFARFFPDLGLGACLTLVAALDKRRERQFAHRRQYIGIFSRQLGIKGHAALGHGARTTEMSRHEGEASLAVLDRIFRLGKLGL